MGGLHSVFIVYTKTINNHSYLSNSEAMTTTRCIVGDKQHYAVALYGMENAVKSDYRHPCPLTLRPTSTAFMGYDKSKDLSSST